MRACVLSCFCLTLCDRLDKSPPGSSARGILQARMLERVAIPFFRRSFQRRDQTWVSCISRYILYHLSHQGSPPGEDAWVVIY